MIDEFQIIFSYSGLISHEMLVNITNVAKKDISFEENNAHKVNKIYEVMIEMLHNILSYSKKRYEIAPNKFESKGNCIISKSQEDESYSVVCVNLIDPHEEIIIKNKIDKVNALTSAQRKAFLKEQLQKTTQPNARGAGLGFFEISRRSNYPIKYDFFTINKERYFAVEAII